MQLAHCSCGLVMYQKRIPARCPLCRGNVHQGLPDRPLVLQPLSEEEKDRYYERLMRR